MKSRLARERRGESATILLPQRSGTDTSSPCPVIEGNEAGINAPQLLRSEALPGETSPSGQSFQL